MQAVNETNLTQTACGLKEIENDEEQSSYCEGTIGLVFIRNLYYYSLYVHNF